MKDAEAYAKSVEAPARRLFNEIFTIVQRHGVEKSLTVGPSIDDLLE